MFLFTSVASPCVGKRDSIELTSIFSQGGLIDQLFPSSTASRISRWGSEATPVAGQLGMPACRLGHHAHCIIIVPIIIGDCNIPMWTIER